MSSNLPALNQWLSEEFEIDANFQSEEVIIENLRLLISDLIEHDLERLYQILYRVDVNEYKLKSALQDSALSDSAQIIAQMIFDRQISKIETRRKYSSDQEGDW